MVFSPTKENLAVVRHLLEHDYSVNVIAARFHCTERCIRRWKARFEEEANGGPAVQNLRATRVVWRKMTEDRLQIVKAHLASPEGAFSSVKYLPQALQIPVCEKTIRRALKKYTDVRYHPAASKAELREADEIARLNYAEQYVDWPDENWTRTICMDEKVFSSTKDGRIGVWRPKGERFNKRYVIPIKKSGRVTQNYYGWMWHGGTGRLIPLTRNLNAELYVQLLNEHFYPVVQHMFPDRRPVYIIEDNCPVHTAHLVTDWYNQHPRLVRLPHPARSPDLNPIENLWSIMVKPWRDVPHNLNELQNRVNQSWNTVGNNLQFFHNLMESMPTRLQTVIQNGGSYTNY